MSVELVTLENKKLVVTQSTELVNSSYKMTVDEKLLLALFVGLIRKDDNDFVVYRISAAEIRRKLNWEAKNFYERIKDVTMRLFDRKVYIQRDGELTWLALRWIGSCMYVSKGERGAKESYLEFGFPSHMKPYLLELQKYFSSYDFQNIRDMGSFHAIRLFEILNAARYTGCFEISLDDLKKRLGVEGKYSKSFFDFRKYVLDISQREITANSNLRFDYTTVKAPGSKAVVGLVFRIWTDAALLDQPKQEAAAAPAPPTSAETPEAKQTPLFPPSPEDNAILGMVARVYDEAKQSGLAPETVKTLLEGRNPAHVLENIELARKRFFDMPEEKRENANLGGLTREAITADYSAPEREKRRAAEAAKESKESAQQAAKKRKSAAEALESIRTAGRKERNAARTAIWEATPPDEQERHRAAFVLEIESGKHGDIMRDTFKNGGWKAPGMELVFLSYIAATLLPPEIEALRAIAQKRGLIYDELVALAEGAKV
jgi:plasmid replication initiation protein